MGKCFLYGNGGGAPLNFKVVRYASEADLPETAKENTLAVFTDVDIDGWHFGAKQPDEMKQGMVWIATSASSSLPINVLKKNCINVYPTYAKQYIDGELVTKPIKCYQRGEWRSLELIFFEMGVFNTGVFGEISGTQKIESNGSFHLYRNQNVSHTTLVDITSYSKFQFEITVMDWGYPVVTIYNASGTTIATFGRYESAGVITVDVSGIKEPVRIQIAVTGNKDGNNSMIDHVKFLP